MKQFKDPFEAAFEEQQEDSPPESPSPADDFSTQPSAAPTDTAVQEEDDVNAPSTSAHFPSSTVAAATKNKDEEDEEEEENMEVELSKFPSGGDPDKMAKMQWVLPFHFACLCHMCLSLETVVLYREDESRQGKDIVTCCSLLLWRKVKFS